MCKAVHALHSAGILHCDVKPCNFVLVQGRLKIIDFGISKHIVDVNDQIVVSQELQVSLVLCRLAFLPSCKCRSGPLITWLLRP